MKYFEGNASFEVPSTSIYCFHLPYLQIEWDPTHNLLQVYLNTTINPVRLLEILSELIINNVIPDYSDTPLKCVK
jgi:hypothetical protein